jgi:hypothetical protein
LNVIEENLHLLSFPQGLHCSNMINHSRQRRMTACFILKGLILIAVKTVSSLYLMIKNDWTVSYFSSLIINILFTNLSSLAGYQFVFFSYCAKCRYEAFVAYAKQQLMKFRYGKVVTCSHDNIQLIDDLASLHFKMAKVFANINAVFSIEVSRITLNCENLIIKYSDEA